MGRRSDHSRAELAEMLIDAGHRHLAESGFARFSAREVASVDEIPPGEGALVRLHGKPVAAYRDETGELSLHSAVCTHAGCVVHWNGFERCWDCPCHGSQFSPDGEVLNGPAAKPLSPVEQLIPCSGKDSSMRPSQF